MAGCPWVARTIARYFAKALSYTRKELGDHCTDPSFEPLGEAKPAVTVS